MPEPDREFQERLLATFREEADEHLQAIDRGLAELEGSTGAVARAPVVERVFREAHSLKGAARAVGLRSVEASCQMLESLLARAKRGELPLNAAAIEEIHGHVMEIRRHLGYRADSDVSADTAPTERPAAEKATDETVRISTAQLDRLVLQVEELIPARWVAARQSAEARELCDRMEQWSREYDKVQRATSAVRRRREGNRRTIADPGDGPLAALLEFIQWSNAFSREIGERLTQIARSMHNEQLVLSAMVDSLQQDTRLLLLRPFTSITEAFPRLVRDLGRQQEKDIALRISGADIEIDRRILQEMKDALIHLVRNSIDHGIESPQVRAQAGKAAQGTVSVSIERTNANRVTVVVADDGAGIDLRRVREAAVRSELRTADQVASLGEPEAIDLIFQSGLSTSPRVTDISGRGLGMAIVREKVERLGGDISVQSVAGQGTSITLVLPLALSTIRGVVVREAARLFIIPVTFVERVVRLPAGTEALRMIENRATALIGDTAVSLVRLRDVLGIASPVSQERNPAARHLVILASADRRVAFEVDEILDERDFLLRNLGPLLVRVRNIGGAAVLSTGELVPVLNAADLLKSAITASAPPTNVVPENPGVQPIARKKILVVDDSITARTLLKGILETAGYTVRTAVDGAEAFALVREEPFDLVVSDVDMPRMNGFELTERIRADRRLIELPVVLVTALESREDRERGMDAGANAYIAKSSFEQGNLLEVIGRYAEREQQ